MTYDRCKKCGKYTIALKGEGYSGMSGFGHHENITAGWYCRKCKILYLNPNFKFNEIIYQNITTPKPFKRGESIVTSKEKLQREKGMIWN